VDPLSHLQVELFERVRAGGGEARDAMLATISGFAAGCATRGKSLPAFRR
jgi:phosphoenolpyruvate carboxylase